MTNGKLPNIEHFDSKAEVSKYAAASGLPTTYFLAGCYMDNFPAMFRAADDDNNSNNNQPKTTWTLSIPLSPAGHIPLFSPRDDTGKFVKGIVARRDALLGADVRAATARYSPADLLDGWRAAFPGTPAAVRHVPDDQHVALLRGLGLPPHGAVELNENFRLMDGAFDYYGGKPLSLDVLVDGDRPTTWTEFAKKNPAFKDLV